ncbi:phage tail protein [Roseibium algae]|uniref:Phage tail protein n=1 Tax=Roseibium algae TaxID=3123038 RepID=A0ABU8TJW4_9HYPH
MSSLMPLNSTPFELGLADAVDLGPRISSGIASIPGWKVVTKPAALLPFLVYEYGLEDLRPFIPNLYELVSEGRQWARIRGTHGSITQGLGWLGYFGTIENPPTRRNAWADFQLNLDRIREDEDDLPRIEGIVSLSGPARSHFRRGVHGYDVPAAEGGFTRIGFSIFGDDSGARIDGGRAKWSFGRTFVLQGSLKEPDLTELETWIPEVIGSLWADMQFLWSEANFAWSLPAEQARRQTIGAALDHRPTLIRLDNGDGGIIGYRRAIARTVSSIPAGPYVVDGVGYAPDEDRPEKLLVQARTGFGDGAGQTVSDAFVVFDAELAPGVPDGKLWLEPSEVLAGIETVSGALTLELGETSREHIQFLLGF